MLHAQAFALAFALLAESVKREKVVSAVVHAVAPAAGLKVE